MSFADAAACLLCRLERLPAEHRTVTALALGVKIAPVPAAWKLCASHRGAYLATSGLLDDALQAGFECTIDRITGKAP